LESMRLEAEQRLEEAEQRLEVARSELTAGHQLALATLRQDFQLEQQQQLSRLEFKQNSCVLFFPVLRIRDILVWIRIRGSMPLTESFFCSILFEGTFTSFFKDKVFHTIFAWYLQKDPDPYL
jgi:hypothetical protein